MGKLRLDNETTPADPGAGKTRVYADDGSYRLCALSGELTMVTGTLSRCWSTASQSGFSSDTYVTGSGLVIPSCGMQVGQVYRWMVSVQKTAAGTAQVVYTIRIGANQTTADTARWQNTAVIAQTATADGGLIVVTMGVRSVSATGVIAAGVGVTATAGFGGGVDGASAAFDNSALAGQYVGLSINGGASASWTIQHVSGELIA